MRVYKVRTRKTWNGIHYIEVYFNVGPFFVSVWNTLRVDEFGEYSILLVDRRVADRIANWLNYIRYGKRV